MNRTALTSIATAAVVIFGLVGLATRTDTPDSIALGTATTTTTAVPAPTSTSTTTTLPCEWDPELPADDPDCQPPPTTTTSVPDPVVGGQFPLSVDISPQPALTGQAVTFTIQCDHVLSAERPGSLTVVFGDGSWREVLSSRPIGVGSDSFSYTWRIPAGIELGLYNALARCGGTDAVPPLDVPVLNRYVEFEVVQGPAQPTLSIPDTK